MSCPTSRLLVLRMASASMLDNRVNEAIAELGCTEDYARAQLARRVPAPRAIAVCLATAVEQRRALHERDEGLSLT